MKEFAQEIPVCADGSVLIKSILFNSTHNAVPYFSENQVIFYVAFMAEIRGMHPHASRRARQLAAFCLKGQRHQHGAPGSVE